MSVAVSTGYAVSPLADGEVRNGVRRTIASPRRQTWRENELRSWLNYSHPTRHTFPHTVESERQVLLIGQTIDEMREEGYSDAVILRECQVLNARHFAPPLDPAPLRGFIDYVLSRGRLYDAVAAESALARASETCSDV